MPIHIILTFALILGMGSAYAESQVRLGPYDGYEITHHEAKDTPVIIYLHGYGSNGRSELDAFEAEIQSNKLLQKYNWLFPDSGREGWHPVEIILPTNDLSEKEIAEHPILGNPSLGQKALARSRSKLDKMLKQEKIDPKNVIWGGFSWGAGMAADYVLHSKTRPLGLIVHAGVLPTNSPKLKTNEVLKGVPFVMVHSPTDPILGFQDAQRLEHAFKQNGMVGKLEKYRDYFHEIPKDSMVEAVSTIMKCNKAFAAIGPKKAR